MSDRSRRNAGDVEAAMTRMWQALGVPDSGTVIVSGATGVEPATGEERAFLARHPDLAVAPPAAISGTGRSRNLR